MAVDECREPSRGSHRLAPLYPILLALVVVWYHFRIPGITADGVTYLQIARNILMGKGLGWQALWASPLHSICIAGTSALAGIPDLLTVSVVVSSAMFFGLIVAVYYLALELFDLRTALFAAVITALFPHLHFIAFNPEAEMTYTFAVVLALLFFARAVLRNSTPYAAAAGIAFSFAWMTRSEGVMIMAFTFGCVTLVKGRDLHRSPILRHCLVGVLFFMLTAAPYLLFLHKHYGAWVLSPKSSYVMTWMKGSVYHDHNKGELDNDELWGLTQDGSKLRWQEPKGVGDLARYLMSDPGHSVSVYLRNLGMQLPGRIPNNSGMDGWPQVYPVYLVLAAVFAVFLPWGGGREKKALLLAPLLILFVLPVFTEGWWKYLVPYVPFLIVMAAKGISAGCVAVAGRMAPTRATRLGVGLLCLVAALIGGRFLLALHPSLLAQGAPARTPSTEISARVKRAEETRKAGLWGVRHFGRGKNFMARWSKIVYYLEGQWTALPVANDPEVLRYARRNGVDYIVVEKVGAQAASIPPSDAADVGGIYRSDDGSYAAIFYRPN